MTVLDTEIDQFSENSFTIKPSFVSVSWRVKSPLLVTYKSPFRFRLILEKYARYYKKENPESNASFLSTETIKTRYFTHYDAYIFFEAVPGNEKLSKVKRCIATGCCCFSKSGVPLDGSQWMLNWEWFHPFFRSRNIFQSHWNKFEEAYGKFHVASPYPLDLIELVKEKGLDKAPAHDVVKY